MSERSKRKRKRDKKENTGEFIEPRRIRSRKRRERKDIEEREKKWYVVIFLFPVFFFFFFFFFSSPSFLLFRSLPLFPVVLAGETEEGYYCVVVRLPWRRSLSSSVSVVS